MSLLTLIGMSLAGVLMVKFFQHKPYDYFAHTGKPVFIQIAMGLFYGSLTAILAILLVNNKQFIGIKDFFSVLIHEINPSIPQIIFYSLCAGVGEEILFRAGIQPLVGIWPAAFIFVLLHGYLNPSNFSMSVYGMFLVVVCAGFGYLFKIFGIYAAITAHFLYDVAMFCVLKYSARNQTG